MAIFGDEPDPADIENDYLLRVVPEEAADLWDESIENSPTWNQFSPEDHMYLADMFARAVYSGSLDLAEEWTEYLEIEWDNHDIHSFYEAYSMAIGR